MRVFHDNHAKEIILSRITPEMVIERYTGQQARHGKYLCPFHNDHHPSLSVKGTHWRCWSCGEKGDVFDFVQKYFGIGFREAMQKLSDDFGLGIELKGKLVTDPVEKLWEAVRMECIEKNRKEMMLYRNEIDSEIERLTTIHRELFHHGADEETLSRYADEIDELIAYREKI